MFTNVPAFDVRYQQEVFMEVFQLNDCNDNEERGNGEEEKQLAGVLLLQADVLLPEMKSESFTISYSCLLLRLYK